MAAVLFFIVAALGALAVIFCGYIDPKSLVFVAPVMGWKIFVCIRHGLRLQKEKQIRESAEYIAVERAVNDLVYLGADIEHVLQNLPNGLHFVTRQQTVGFLNGGFRSFERVTIEGPSQLVLVDSIRGIVAGKRISVRAPVKRSS
jgi:hypothetical protein